MADEAEHRGEQRDRRGHHEQHRQRRTDREPADERHADHEQAEERDHDRAAREQHRAAARVDRVHDRALGIDALVQRLPVARADEQRVVDADADADHRRDLRRERRDVHHPGEQRDERQPDPDAEHRGHDRQAHREQRTEREEQDEHRGEDADRLTRRLRLVGEHVTAELHLDLVAARLAHDAAHVRREIDRHVVRLHVELDLGVRDLPVLGDEPRVRRVVRRRRST